MRETARETSGLFNQERFAVELRALQGTGMYLFKALCSQTELGSAICRESIRGNMWGTRAGMFPSDNFVWLAVNETADILKPPDLTQLV